MSRMPFSERELVVRALQQGVTDVGTRINAIVELAKFMAATTHCDWDDLPDTDEEAALKRDPGCCNFMDCKEDWLDLAEKVIDRIGGEHGN